ncbi:MAG: hypothetical protein GX624_09470 [Actinobacteria bacterium]|nr:hypothetical protein [Actinomycetota bacterium]
MLIATFGPTTAWVGKTISYDDGRYTLEDFGEIGASAVVDYDRHGHLVWAYDGLREWVYQTAGEPVQSAAAAQASEAAATEGQGVAPSAAEAQGEGPAPAEAPPAGAEPGSAEAHAAAEVTAQTLNVEASGAVDAQSPAAGPAAGEQEPAVEAVAAAAPAPATAPTAGPAGPTAGPVEPAAAQPTGGEPGRGASRRGWFILGGVVIVALIIGVLVTDGRWRDGLGVAFTLVAALAVVALVIAAVKPATLGRWFGGAQARTLVVTFGVVAAGCFVLAAVLWWMPHYEVVAPADTRIALDEKPEITVLVVNRGLFGGTYSAAYAVDGHEQDAVAFPLGGGDGRELTLSLSTDAERGPVLLTLGGASIEARAVLPPTFTVAPLQLDPSPAKLGDSVVLATTVENVGDLAGTFDGVLTANGEEFLTQPVKVGPGRSVDVTYDITADVAGEYDLTLGDAAATFVVVEPVRLKNGYVIKRSVSGGRASLSIVNKTGSDAVAVFTRTSNKRKPVLAVYVRAGKKAKLTGIPDGSYVFWDCCGSDFNWTMRDFYTPVEYKRWLDPLEFDTTQSTKRWTTYWSDAYYNYSQGHTRTTTHWTNWTITLGTGESKYTRVVEETGFPQF